MIMALWNWFFKKTGIYPLALWSICPTLLLSNIFQPWDRFLNKLFRSDKGDFEQESPEPDPPAEAWMHQVWVAGAHLCFCSGEPWCSLLLLIYSTSVISWLQPSHFCLVRWVRRESWHKPTDTDVSVKLTGRCYLPERKRGLICPCCPSADEGCSERCQDSCPVYLGHFVFTAI